VWIECTDVTDRQTDGHRATAKTALKHSHVGPFYFYDKFGKSGPVFMIFSLLNRPELTKYVEAAGHCSGNMNLHGRLPRNPGRCPGRVPSRILANMVVCVWTKPYTAKLYVERFARQSVISFEGKSYSYNPNFLHRSFPSLTVKKSRTLVHFFRSYHKNTSDLLFVRQNRER